VLFKRKKEENMNFAKRLLMLAGAVALASLLGAVIAPRAAHAVIATLVQVVNNVAVVNPLDGNGNQIPLLTKDSDSPIRSPFDVEVFCVFGNVFGDNVCLTNILNVPGGQVAKVEYASLFCQTSTPVKVVDLQDNASGSVQDHFLTIPGGTLQSQTGFGQTMNFYVVGSAAANNAVRSFIQGDATTTGRCFITISGYLAAQ
jgi:hypothetical protein